MGKIPDFVEDLEHKFAALSPDILPSLQSYLQDSDIAKIGSENVPITPSPSSGVNASIPQRTSLNSSQILHYDDENLTQDQVLNSEKKKAFDCSTKTSVQGLPTEDLMANSSTARPDLSNGTTLASIALLQAELQAAEDEEPRLKN